MIPLLLLGAQPARAADLYANEVAHASLYMQSPANAVGAPDQLYADFLSSYSTMTLDLGEGEEGIGNLTISYLMVGAGTVTPIVTLFDDEMREVGGSSVSLTSETATALVGYSGETPYRFVRIAATSNRSWKLDAVASSRSYVAPVEEVEIPTDAGIVDEDVDTFDARFVPGDLLKSRESSAVYVYGSDGMRHAFPNEEVFYSWEYDFTNVTIVTAEEMASYPLGRNVTMRPGVYLVKLQSDASVYAVAPGGVLRLIPDEGTAIVFFGADWAHLVRDIPDVFWLNYVMGGVLNSSEEVAGWSFQFFPY